jgi:hypothetical protein
LNGGGFSLSADATSARIGDRRAPDTASGKENTREPGVKNTTRTKVTRFLKVPDQKSNLMKINELGRICETLPEVKNVSERGFLEENEDFSLARWANLGQPL